MEENSGTTTIGLFDTVRVVSNELTIGLGLAGLIGTVHGQTVPSSSGVTDIVGHSSEDYAINAFFEERNEGFWFAPELLQWVDNGVEVRISLGEEENKKTWIRPVVGEWYEEK